MATKYTTWETDEKHSTVAEAVASLSGAKDYVYALDNEVPRALNSLERVQEQKAKEAPREQSIGEGNSEQTI